jgi:hypothetical protein
MAVEVKKKDKSILSIFIVMTLSLIVIASGYIDNSFLKIGMQMLLLLLQFVIIKNILDDYYKHF